MSTSSSKPPHAESSRKPRGTMTIDEFMALPEDGNRYELLDGELIQVNAPTWHHQTVMGNIFAILLAHVRKNDLGRVIPAPSDVVLEPRSVCQPDTFFVAKSRLSTLMASRQNTKGAPDLGVEVISPSSRRYDRIVKARIYTEAEMRHYWIVDPEAKTVEEMLLDAGAHGYRLNALHEGVEETFRPAIFPGLELPLVEIFRDVP